MDTSWIAYLIQLGVAGVMLAWFMFRNETRQKAVEAALDRSSRAITLLVITLGSKPAKELAETIQGEITAAEQSRNK